MVPWVGRRWAGTPVGSRSVTNPGGDEAAGVVGDGDHLAAAVEKVLLSPRRACGGGLEQGQRPLRDSGSRQRTEALSAGLIPAFAVHLRGRPQVVAAQHGREGNH